MIKKEKTYLIFIENCTYFSLKFKASKNVTVIFNEEILPLPFE